ncbi:CFI-box-CTERM domain-containing protein [Paracoccus sp. MC1862]|uniref:CAP domain-containing protein n=1 Tax=Paracoccus sp. MC1862 TaxID=2760307 RepID=UPI001602B8D7|nr:CFI-box-CTERM domain-containing protein [Paracoccus sp. MC1862]MBB1498942.1 hypothetical protein [Paracoccus sp. MC1862]QQO46738.1 hypothetical protein JGR78_17290 [Paracoccus sp. MC1862]
MAVAIADPIELRVVEIINAERAAAGLQPLHTEVHLNSSAQHHSNWMAESGVLSHTGENGSTPSDRAEDADFPMQGASWRVTENLSYVTIGGSIDEDEIARMHSAMMESPSHQANILDPNVDYIGVGLTPGQIEEAGELHDVVFLTQNFGDSSDPVLVQEEVGGETVLTTYVDGEAVPGTSQPAPEIDSDDDEALDPSEDNASEDEDEDEDSASDDSCFVATAAYGDSLHPDVIILRRFRDELLVRYRLGRAFVRFYWIIGPRLAKVVRPNHFTGRLTRHALRPCVRAAGSLLKHNN